MSHTWLVDSRAAANLLEPGSVRQNQKSPGHISSFSYLNVYCSQSVDLGKDILVITPSGRAAGLNVPQKRGYSIVVGYKKGHRVAIKYMYVPSRIFGI